MYCIQPNYEGSNQTVTIKKRVCVWVSESAVENCSGMKRERNFTDEVINQTFIYLSKNPRSLWRIFQTRNKIKSIHNTHMARLLWFVRRNEYIYRVVNLNGWYKPYSNKSTVHSCCCVVRFHFHFLFDRLSNMIRLTILNARFNNKQWKMW